MQQGSHSQPGADKKIIARISAFLARHGKALVIVLILAAVALITLFVTLTVRSNRIEASLIAVEQLQSDYYDWQGLGPDEQTAGYPDLHAEAEALVADYPRVYAASRALLIDAEALFALERYQESAGQYAALADRFPESYMAPIGLIGAAVASENAGDTDRALQYFTRVVDDYGDTSHDAARALFSIGRIHETRDEIADAEHYYNQLIQDYPTSTWTDLARTRIISLTAEGRIGGT